MSTLCVDFMKIGGTVCQKNRVKVDQKGQISKFTFFRLSSTFFEYYRDNGWGWGKIGFNIRKSLKLRTIGLGLVSLRFIYT